MKWQGNNGRQYSAEELEAMQKDAMARVREMQRRADETLRRGNRRSLSENTAVAPSDLPPPPQAPVPTVAVAPLSPPPSVESKEPLAGGKLRQILSVSGIDQDRLILLGLLLILYNEDADPLLLLALLYLLL